MKKTLFLLGLTAIGFTACEKDDPIKPDAGEEELITTVELTLSANNEEDIVLTYKDLDGEGGEDPVATVSRALSDSTEYTTSLRFLNESGGETEDITKEIQEEDEAHQVFISSTAIDVTFTYSDKDADGNPIGLKGKLTTVSGSQNAKLTVTLIHEPNKDADGVSEGKIANAGGETDVEAKFSIDIE